MRARKTGEPRLCPHRDAKVPLAITIVVVRHLDGLISFMDCLPTAAEPTPEHTAMPNNVTRTLDC
jgi:hypothetical protein